jgi:hypothetical protein
MISSGLYGLILVVVMLLRPQGLVPTRRTAPAAKLRTLPRPRPVQRAT